MGKVTAIPAPANTLCAAIDAAHEARIETPRQYLGASVLGDPDDRGLWLSFRGVFEQQFQGRILRLFRRGQLEELTAVQDLIAAGCVVLHTGANQLSTNLGGHLAGHADGIIESGVPEAPKTRHLWECKTHSKKSFDDVVKNGVRKSKPQHWVQMQCYMHGLGLTRALYYAVCKDDDSIYTERVEYDKAAAQAAIDRGRRITTADRMPEPIYHDPTYFEAKFSPFYSVYFPASAQASDWRRLKSQRDSHVNILSKIKCSWKNCARTTVRADGTWWSEKYDCAIPSDRLDTYSENDHLLHPDVMALAGWEFAESASTPDVFVFSLPTGEKVKNGAPAFGVYSSEELLSAPQVCAAQANEETFQKLRTGSGARVTADEVPF